jgi:hypothetical protein
MSDIVLNPDGTSIWTDAREKLEAVKSALTPHLQRIKTKWEYNENSQYPRKLNFSVVITQRLTLEFRKFPTIQSRYATQIDIHTLKEYINCFYDLVEFIMDYYEDFLVTKIMFCQWLGISAWSYDQLLISPDPDVLTEMSLIDEMLVNSTLLSAQEGKTKEKSSELRMRVEGVGHSVVMKPNVDEKPTINVVAYDIDSVKSMISGFGLNTKAIENKKK